MLERADSPARPVAYAGATALVFLALTAIVCSRPPADPVAVGDTLAEAKRHLARGEAGWRVQHATWEPATPSPAPR